MRRRCAHIDCNRRAYEHAVCAVHYRAMLEASKRSRGDAVAWRRAAALWDRYGVRAA